MRTLLTETAVVSALAFGVVAPAEAQAQDIPGPLLQQSLAECVRACDPAHSLAFCTEICGCMTGQMSGYWDLEEFQARMDRLRSNPEDERIKEEMSRLAGYCAERIE